MKNLRKNRIFLFSRVHLRRLGQWLTEGVLLLYGTGAWAATVDKTDETWGGLYGFVSGLFTGGAALVLSLLALAAGLLAAAFTSHKMAAIIGAIGVPVAIQVGPGIFERLSGAVL